MAGSMSVVTTTGRSPSPLPALAIRRSHSSITVEGVDKGHAFLPFVVDAFELRQQAVADGLAVMPVLSEMKKTVRFMC